MSRCPFFESEFDQTTKNNLDIDIIEKLCFIHINIKKRKLKQQILEY